MQVIIFRLITNFLLGTYKFCIFFFSFSYDDIHRHSKIYYGICLHSANVNCFFFRMLFRNGFVSFYLLHKLIYRELLSLLFLVRLLLLVWSWHTHIYAYFHVSIYHTQKIHGRLSSERLTCFYSTKQLHIDFKIFADFINFLEFFSIYFYNLRHKIY